MSQKATPIGQYIPRLGRNNAGDWLLLIGKTKRDVLYEEGLCWDVQALNVVSVSMDIRIFHYILMEQNKEVMESGIWDLCVSCGVCKQFAKWAKR